MLQLSKRSLIIIVAVVIIAVIIIIADIFLFLKYKQTQEAAQQQAKINSDIVQVQQTIQSGQVSELNVEELKLRGFAEEAIEIARQAILEDQERQAAEIMREQQERPIEEKALEKIAGISELRRDKISDIRAELVEDKDILIPAFAEEIKKNDINTRYNAYYGLYLIAVGSESDKQDIVEILKQGLQDPDPVNRVRAGHWLLNLHEKEAILPIINTYQLVKDNNNMFVPVDPPVLVKDYILTLLYDKVYIDDELNELGWVAWYEKNKDNIQWDESINKFKSIK